MCKISDNIKFCTCEVEEDTQLDHYWILHRKGKSSNVMIMGEVMPNDFEKLPEFKINSETLCGRINEHDAFDKPITFKNNDHFEIIFNNNDPEKLTIYCFIYKKRKWVITKYKSFELANKYNKLKTGVFENPFMPKEPNAA